MEDVCKTLGPGNHPFKKYQHCTAGLIMTLMYAFISFLFSNSLILLCLIGLDLRFAAV